MKWYRKSKIDRRNAKRRLKEVDDLRCNCGQGLPVCSYHKGLDNVRRYRKIEPQGGIIPGKNVRKKKP